MSEILEISTEMFESSINMFTISKEICEILTESYSIWENKIEKFWSKW